MEWKHLLVGWGLPGLVVLLMAAGLVWTLLTALPDRRSFAIIRPLLVLGIVLATMVLLVLVLPFDNETRGQILSLFGLVLTAIIALASTTFVSNAMAGFMLRSVASFHPGDFIRIGEHFGRVTETALFHTEIQSEDRDLVTLPNLFIVTQPVRVVRSSGTLISATVSLGYDVHRRRIRELLNQAAEDAGLTDPFVQITELGDFSIGYRVSGFLGDVNSLVSTRTELHNRVLDQLHQAGVEIVSPNFMNQRVLDPGIRFIPAGDMLPVDAEEDQPGQAERIMFDKAELAGRVERLRRQRDSLLDELKLLKEAGDPAKAFEITWRERQVASLEEILTTLESREPFEKS